MAEKQFSTFYLDENLFGINILMVSEINRNTDITPVEHAPDFVRGLINLRGQIITVLDLGVKLGLAAREITSKSRIIVLKTSTELSLKHVESSLVQEASIDLVGLLVDNIGDMVGADEKAITKPPANMSSFNEKFITGVISLENRLVALLNVGRLLKMEAAAAV